MSDLVRNPEDRFSCDILGLSLVIIIIQIAEQYLLIGKPWGQKASSSQAEKSMPMEVPYLNNRSFHINTSLYFYTEQKMYLNTVLYRILNIIMVATQHK